MIFRLLNQKVAFIALLMILAWKQGDLSKELRLIADRMEGVIQRFRP